MAKQKLALAIKPEFLEPGMRERFPNGIRAEDAEHAQIILRKLGEKEMAYS